MLPVLRGVSVAVIGDGGAGEVERAAVGGGDHFDGIGVVDVFRSAGDLEGGDLGVRLREGFQKSGEVLGFEEGFVALDVDVDFCIDELRDGVDAVGSAGKVGRSELDGPVVLAAKICDLVRVRSDEEGVELRAGSGGLIDPGEHGASGDGAEDFAGKAGGGEARWDDSKDSELLFAAGRIKYHRTCNVACIVFGLCRGDSSFLCHASISGTAPKAHIGGVAQLVRATDS